MKIKPAFVVACILFATISSATGQAPAPAAPAAAPPAATAPAPAATPPRLDMKPPARPARVPIAGDARGCLEFPSNFEVIKCAEKYLRRG